ncbi:toll-like receptor 12 [Sphaerodactylus townsendi]|uniref:toll-like receptor 12 n=1 Tax=Sphaerodactylus townsendi TaxID=933632 RepID=UPI0020269400|nr:toll-like receptor 12 [Sphaerodactylus townsendi]
MLSLIMLFWLGLPVHLALMSTHCRQIEGPLHKYVKKFFFFCNPPVNTSLVVGCNRVTALPEDIIDIPRGVQALCLFGRIKVLREWAFQAFPDLRYLSIPLAPFVISPGAFQGLRTLQHLAIMHGAPASQCINITSLPDILLSMHSLQTLYLGNICLTKRRAIMLPSTLRSLTFSVCSQVQLSVWLDIFPSLRSVSQVTVKTCRNLGPFSARHHNYTTQPAIACRNEEASPEGQRSPLKSLKLIHFPLTLSDLLNLEIEELDSLSLDNTDPVKENKTSLVCALASRFSLRSLKLSRNHYRSFDGEELHACCSLKSLVLQDNKMENVDILLLSKLPQLRQLDLSVNKLHWALCPTVYKSMNFASRLQTLDFSKNNITSLPADAFDCLTYLEKLSLNSCGIKKIDPLAFSGLNNLTVLNLNRNHIKYLEKEVFSNLSKLASLDLNDNPIEVLRKDFFLHRNMLRELSFGSPTGDLDVEFSVLDLKVLQIACKSRTRFWGGSIKVFSTLERLTLSCHQLEVDSCKYPLFPQMKGISLTGLHRVTVSCNSSRPFLHHFPLLENFDCRMCLWKGFNLSHLPNLRILVMVNAGITLNDVSQDDAQYLFRNLAKLEVMSLYSSGLQYISAVLFRDMKNLRLLLLENELLLRLDSGFQNELMQLRYLYLQSITFGCDCSNAWLVSWAVGLKDLHVSMRSSVQCQELTTVKKIHQFLPFVEQNCSLKIDFILFLVTFCLVLSLLSVPLVHATWGTELLFLIYLLRGWWRRLRGEIRKGTRYGYDAFVSYCSQDQEWVLQYLVPNLEQKGSPALKLCLHSRDFMVGKATVDNIMDSLYNSRKTICVISRHSLCSHWCSLEMSLATYRLLAGREDTLILIFLERISRYRLSASHRLAKLVKKKTYLNWPEEPAAQLAFWHSLRNSFRRPHGEEESSF